MNLTQFLWQQEENLSDVSGIWLGLSRFDKELQVRSTVKYGPLFISNFSNVSSLSYKDIGLLRLCKQDLIMSIGYTHLIFFNELSEYRFGYHAGVPTAFLKSLYIILEHPRCFLTRTDIC